jgi:hypothetical protein
MAGVSGWMNGAASFYKITALSTAERRIILVGESLLPRTAPGTAKTTSFPARSLNLSSKLMVFKRDVPSRLGSMGMQCSAGWSWRPYWA